MLGGELCDVPYCAVDHDPAVILPVVRGDFFD